MYSLFLSFTTCLIFCAVATRSKAQTIIAYYNGDARAISLFPVNELTHIIYAFGYLKDGKLSIGNTDGVALTRLVKLKQKYPSLKIILSMGGWGGCRTCSAVFSSQRGRQVFASSVATTLNRFHADGIDIDWEWPAGPGYPGHPWSLADRDDFTALIETLRKELGNQKEITFLAAAFAPYLQHSYDWPRLMAAVTRVHLMTYDLIGSRSPITGHHAALYSSGVQTESADHAVRYLDSLGVPLNKITIGVALYAREFTNVPDTAHGLFQPGAFRRFISLKELHRGYEKNYDSYWDTTAQAPYRYNAKQKIFLTYDDKHSAAEKATYVRRHHLDGLFLWQLTLDQPRGGVVDTLYKTLH